MLQLRLGNRLAPVRFLAFVLIFAAGVPLLGPMLGWRHGTMGAFDVAAAAFMVSLWPLLARCDTRRMRAYADSNDANRALLLVITAAVMGVILVAVGSELLEKNAPKGTAIALIVVTLMMTWLFSNTIYALHYAHVYYTQADLDRDGDDEDTGGLDFPGSEEPNYWDFIYFSFTLGMTFQTSDTGIRSTRMRRLVTFHSLAAFVFNLGVLAFTINTLGGGGN